LDPCVYDVFDSASPKEVTPEVVTLTPGTLCIKSAFNITTVEVELKSYSEIKDINTRP